MLSANYIKYLQYLFNVEYVIDAAIFINAIITMGFLLTFYRQNISPIASKSKQAVYWKSAWMFLAMSILFFFLSSFIDIIKFLNIKIFFEIELVTRFVELSFIIFLGMGLNMLNRRFSDNPQ